MNNIFEKNLLTKQKKILTKNEKITQIKIYKYLNKKTELKFYFKQVFNFLIKINYVIIF
jgi:hypothetical protein